MSKDTEVYSDDINNLSKTQKQIAKKIHDEAVNVGLDPEYALSIGWIENRFKPHGQSSKDAIGPMQIWKYNAPGLGVSVKDLYDPDTNIKLGVQLLKSHLDKHNGDKTLAAVEYNATPKVTNRFIKAGYDPNVLPEETRKYLIKLNDLNDTNENPEVSPFDTYKQQNEATEGESPFSQRGELPKGFFDELPSQKQQSILGSIVSGAEENPELTSMGLAPATAFSQYLLNKNQPKEDILGKQLPIPTIEEQFKAQQAGLEEEINKIKTTPQQQPQSAGDKWAAKVTGSMGPGGESVTEAARSYQIQKGLEKEGLTPKWRPNREGVILPTPIAQQQESVDLLEQQRAQDEATRESRAEVERRKAALAQRYQADIREAMKRQSPLNRMGMATGKFMTTNPTVTGLFQAPAGYFANEARERAKRGDILGSAISSVKAVGAEIGGLPMSPRYKPLMYLKGAGQGAALLGIGADELRRKLGFDPEYREVKPGEIKP